MEDCIEFTGAHSKAGYAQKRVNGKAAYVHRLVYAEKYGPIPEGMCVCHHCDNPGCINIDHLFMGTQADNLRDMREKGRGNFPLNQNPQFGEDNNQTTLKEAEVLEIRDLHGFIPYRKLAKEYDVSIGTILNIQQRRTWGHI